MSMLLLSMTITSSGKYVSTYDSCNTACSTSWFSDRGFSTRLPPMTLQAPLNIFVKLVHTISQQGTTLRVVVATVSSTTTRNLNFRDRRQIRCKSGDWRSGFPGNSRYSASICKVSSLRPSSSLSRSSDEPCPKWMTEKPRTRSRTLVVSTYKNLDNLVSRHHHNREI